MSIANEVQDFFLGEQGSLMLRQGCAKTDRTGGTASIIGIFMVTIAGVQQYGLISAGGLSLLDYGLRLGYSPIPEPLPDLPTDWPAGWPKPTDKVNDTPSSDPLEPVEKQACANSYTITGSPASLLFTMPYGGPAPADQYWFWRIDGFMANSIVGVYSVDESWYSTVEQGLWYWFIGPCNGRLVKAVVFSVSGKDANGNWLAPGTYTSVKSLAFSDGKLIAVSVTLMVAIPQITLAPTSYAYVCVTGDSGNGTETIRVTNSGETGSILNWSAAITGDAALTAICGLSATSGSLAKDAFQDITLTLTNPGGVATGIYSATITFTGLGATTKTFAISLNVVPLYTGQLRFTKRRVVTYTQITGPYLPPGPPMPTDIDVTVVTEENQGNAGIPAWSPNWHSSLDAYGYYIYVGRVTATKLWTSQGGGDPFVQTMGDVSLDATTGAPQGLGESAIVRTGPGGDGSGQTWWKDEQHFSSFTGYP
jgi:hypothetical protein